MEDKLIALWVKCLTCVALCLILTIGSCVMHTDYRVKQVIKMGVDPIAASLALHDTMETKMVLYNLTKTNQALDSDTKSSGE